MLLRGGLLKNRGNSLTSFALACYKPPIKRASRSKMGWREIAFDSKLNLFITGLAHNGGVDPLFTNSDSLIAHGAFKGGIVDSLVLSAKKVERLLVAAVVV